MTTGENFAGRSGFLRLPPEIRDEIYRHLFSAPNYRHYQYDEENGICSYRFDLGIFRTSRLIYEEASRAFYAQNRFACIETPWPQAENYLKKENVATNGSGEKCRDFKRQPLQINITSPGIESNTSGRFLIHTDEILRLCNLWFYSNLTYLDMNPHLSLQLILINQSNPGTPLPRVTQSRLVQHFGLVKGLGKFEIIGDVDADIAEGVKVDMSQPLDSPTTCIEKSINLMAVGDAKIHADKPHEAIEHYRQAFLAIHIVVDGKLDRRIHGERYFEAFLTRPMFGNQSAGFARIVLRIKLVAAVMLAYVKLEDWETVYEWGIRSIRLYRRTLGDGADEPGHQAFPAPDEWGMVYYRTALAAEKLERDEDAREFYGIAKVWLPGNESVAKSLDQFCLRVG